MTLGDEVIGLDRALCFFEEQPRAGLGGVFTHTLQANATNAAGLPLILDMSRARGEDGTVSDEVTVDIGDPREDDFVGLRGGGPEGVVTFGEASASGTDVSVTDFETDPVNLSFEVTCG